MQRKWYESKRVAWGRDFIATVISVVLTYLTPVVGIPVLVLVFLFGLYLVKREYKEISLKRGRRGKMLIGLGSLLIVGGILLIITQLDFHTTTTTETSLEIIIPKLQVTTSDLRDDNAAFTGMAINVLNYSDYVVKKYFSGYQIWRELVEG